MRHALSRSLTALLLCSLPALAPAQTRDCNKTPTCAEGSQWNAETSACEQIVSS